VERLEVDLPKFVIPFLSKEEIRKEDRFSESLLQTKFVS